MAENAPPERWRHRPSLDGLRTVAVYLVLLFHSGLAAARGGFIGVDLFFVLSGFLITNVLLADVDLSGRIRFGRFYARRARRLLLPAVLVIVTTCLVFLLIDSVLERLPLIRDAQSALLYVANWRFLNESNDYFATGVAKSPFLHFWSLGIEEQFYVVFPLLLLLLIKAGRGRAWLPAVGVTILFGLSLADEVYWSHHDPNHAYYGTDARAYQLLAGVLLALALRARQSRLTKRGTRAAEVAAGLGLAGVVLLGSGLIDVSVSRRGMAATAAGVLVIGGLALAEGGPVGRALSHRVPVYLGQISYSTYLWHWPVIVALTTLVATTHLETAAIAAVVATGLAAVSAVVLESPVRGSAVLDRFRWPTVAAGVALCVVVAVALVPPVLHSARRPVLVTAVSQPSHQAPPVTAAQRRRPTYNLKVPSHVDWAALANHNGPGRTCDATDPQQCIVVQGGAPTVVLVGDSHARMLAPVLTQLAREHGFTLAVNAMSSCPWQAQLTNLVLTPDLQAQCTASRDTWYRDVLPQLHPNLVIVASYARDDDAIYGHSLLRTGGSNETLHQLIKNTTNETLARITATGAHAVILDSIIVSSFDPLDCLSRSTYIRQCAVPYPHSGPISDTYYRAAARAHPHQVFTLNINHDVCPGAPACAAMIDGIPVWRNINHYSTKILIHFRRAIWQTIVNTGALTGLP